MDKFKWIILLKTLKSDPLEISIKQFKEIVPTLDSIDLDEIFYVLQESVRSNAQAKHIFDLIEVLWSYR